MKEATYEGETKVDKVVGKVIKMRKSCNTAFQTTSILSFWSTSVNNISKYGKFIDVVCSIPGGCYTGRVAPY